MPSLRQELEEDRIEITTRAGRVWVCALPGRDQLWRAGLLDAAFGVAQAEAGRAADLMHLPEEVRAQVHAQYDAEQVTPAGDDERSQRALANLASQERIDTMLCELVRGRRYSETEVCPVRLVMDRAEERDEDGVEHVWIGRIASVELTRLSSALLATYFAEVRAGVTFRPSQLCAASTG